MKFEENVYLIAIFKNSGGFFSVTHLVQKLLAKNTKNNFSANFKAVFHPFLVLGLEKL